MQLNNEITLEIKELHEKNGEMNKKNREVDT